MLGFKKLMLANAYCRRLALLLLGPLLLPACQSRHEQAAVAATPPVGHYEGTITPAGQAAVRAALDIRHPSPGHYEAELTVPGAGTLGFVADTIFFADKQLRLTRPARPSESLTLTLDGDFWRGTLALDSLRTEALLVKRGTPTPSAYHVEELPQGTGSAWRFAPADTSTPGPALALLPTAATAATAALWADALAREGTIVLVLPAADSTTADTESPRLLSALQLLRSTAGADTATIGLWACGARGTAVAQALLKPGLRVAFLIAQNTEVDAASREAFRELSGTKLPMLGLYSGPTAVRQAAGLRKALGGRRGVTVQTYRGAGPDLLVPGGAMPAFGSGLPGNVAEWLRSR